MKRRFSVLLFGIVLLVACDKKEPASGRTVADAAKAAGAAGCAKQFVADKPVKAGETGIMLPAGTTICLSSDELTVNVQLPEGYAFLNSTTDVVNKPMPFWGTYACYCSAAGSACKVFYADGLGFGCLQNTCTGACTGKFTYQGYSVDRVVYTGSRSAFFSDVAIQKMAAAIETDAPYSKQSMYGVNFYLVNNEKLFLEKAACDCDGTQACKLKVVTIPFIKNGVAGKKLYFCEGGCNGCELTVS